MVFHPYHMVEESPWPIVSSFSAMVFMVGMIIWFHEINMNVYVLSLILILMNFFQWWRDVIREAFLEGCHTSLVKKGLKMGMILFIVSEIFFFFSFFWSYFHNMLSPDLEIGMIWPPQGIEIFNPYQIPLLNTVILLSSGFTITWSHHLILNKNFYLSKLSLLITIFLGMYFSFLQGFEYKQSSFCLNDGIYGTMFFLMTGFHGLHVLIGTVFLIVIFFRLKKKQFSGQFHLGFEASAWYWHFVDVVWLFLYVFVYWWVY